MTKRDSVSLAMIAGKNFWMRTEAMNDARKWLLKGDLEIAKCKLTSARLSHRIGMLYLQMARKAQ